MDVYPNPATSVVHIEYILDQYSSVRIVLTDVTGQQMAEIANMHKPEGIHTHSLNVKNINGLALKKGVYFIQLTAGTKNKVQKLIVH